MYHDNNGEVDCQTLKALDDHLESLPANLKPEWSDAQRQCPLLVGDDHKLLFLRFENFHVELAALRLLRYWAKRVELFGAPRAFEPMTMEGAMRGDLTNISYGSMVWTGAYDERGCGIVYENFERSFEVYCSAHREWQMSALAGGPEGAAVDASSEAPLTSATERPSSRRAKQAAREQKRKTTWALRTMIRRSLVRIAWYIFHVAWQDENVQRNGVLYLARARPYSLSRLRNLFAKERHGNMLVDMLRGCLPIHVRGFHFCQPTIAFRFMLALQYTPSAKGLMMRETGSVLHLGSLKRVHHRLTTQFGFPTTSLPPELGGSLQYDHAAWLLQRRQVEATPSAEDESIHPLEDPEESQLE